MVRQQLTLQEKIDTLYDEVCRDLGIDLDRDEKAIKQMICCHLEEDAFIRARDKMWRNKL